MTKLTLELEYEEFDDVTALPEDEQQLVAAAWEARNNAYAPYSRFKVGAAIQTKDGQIIRGNNQENANYKVSCAERVTAEGAAEALGRGRIAVVVDPQSEIRARFGPDVAVDAILEKRNLGTTRDFAPIVIGLGPGFIAGADVTR